MRRPPTSNLLAGFSASLETIKDIIATEKAQFDIPLVLPGWRMRRCLRRAYHRPRERAGVVKSRLASNG